MMAEWESLHAEAAEHEARLIAFAVAFEANIPIIIWGPPGEGKTKGLNAFAEQRKITHKVVVISQHDPSDLGGIPRERGEGYTRIPPSWVLTTNADDNSLLVFDELNTAQPAQRTPILAVIQERVCGDTPLNPTTRIVAICNPPEMAEDGWELGAPLSNRFLHLQHWDLPTSMFIAGLTTGHWPAIPVLRFEQLERHRAEAAAAVGSFLYRMPALHREMPDDPADRQYPYSTSRSWTNLAELLGYAWAARTAEQDIGPAVIGLLVEGTIGVRGAPAFIEHLETLQFPDPEQVLTNPTGWELPERPDLVWAVLSRIIRYVLDQPADEQKRLLFLAGDAIAYASESFGDVGVTVATEWWQHAKKYGPGIISPALARGRLSAVMKLVS
jgi:hypothetical protein